MALALGTLANVADFRLRVEGFATDDLRVTAFEGAEGLSELFDFRIRMCSPARDIDPDALLGRPAALEIDGEHGTRVIHGILRRFELVGDGLDLAHYEANLVPLHWLLTRRIQSRVFNKSRCPRMDVVGIVSKVLTDAGLRVDDLTVALSRECDTFEFVAQYRESDWNFIARLLEREGIYYYFDHGPEGCKLVLTDSKDSHRPYVPGDARVPFRDPNGLVAQREFVYRARLAGQVQIGAVALDDFNFRQPGQELRREANARSFNGLTLIDTPGDFGDTKRGDWLAQARLQEQQCASRVLTLATVVRGFWPGGRFELYEHSNEGINGEYLVTRVTHRATQPASAEAETADDAPCRYESDVRVIPAAVQFRRPRVTPRPTVLGSQTAIVVGPATEEIHTDEYGRVEVRFHWDQEAAHDAGASCWIRVSQGLAGGNYGMLFLPRVGQEVIVDFLEGNPDRPIITGRVYNNDHMPPYKLPEHKSISTIRTCSTPGAQGGNEIRFDDDKGHEQLLLFAQHDMHLRARANRFETTAGERHATVCGDELEHVHKSKHLNVGLDRLELVGGNDELTVRGDILEKCYGSKRSAFVGGVTLSTAAFRVEAESIVLTCGGNFIKIDSGGVTIVGSMVDINSGGAAGPDEQFPEAKQLKNPRPAATTACGHNTRYSAAPESAAALEASHLSNGTIHTSAETETAWIEIELLDEGGRPCPHEKYEISLPDGSIRRGTLNELGMAHESLPNPGLCQISFPALDAAAWERMA